MDANESIGNGTLQNEFVRNGIRKVLKERIKNLRNPNYRGSEPILGIFATERIKVNKAGMLMMGTGVQGNHWNIFVDFNTESLVGLNLIQIV